MPNNLQRITPQDQWILDSEGNMLGVKNPKANGDDLLPVLYTTDALTGRITKATAGARDMLADIYASGTTPGGARSLVVRTNIYPTNSERMNTINNNTTSAVTHGNAIPANKFGLLTGSIVGTSGNTQSNYTVIADTAYYDYSFVAYVPPGVTGAQVVCTVGFVSGNNKAFTYDWDNPLTASTNFYVPSGSGASIVATVEDLGGGFRRFHNILKNTSKTILYDNFGGSAAANKVTYSGFQIVRIPDDGSAIKVNDYTPVGQRPKPWTGGGRNGGASLYNNRFPFRDVVVFSDSIWGSSAGTAASGSWRLFDSVLEYFGYGSLNVYSGNTTAQVCAQFDTQNVGGAFNGSLVIFNVGRNDAATLLTSSGRDSVLATLDQRIQALGHEKYKVCGVLLKYTCTASPGAEETTATNTAYYAGITAFNSLLALKYGTRFIDMQAVSVNSYNPLDASDVAAFAIGMRPPSLAPLTGDGTHPGPLENMVMGAAVVESIKSEYGVS